MITHLENVNAIEKLSEIDVIGFGFVKRIPKWAVKQSITLQLAKAYDVKTNTLIVDVGNIWVNSELIGKALGIRDGDRKKVSEESTSRKQSQKRAHKTRATHKESKDESVKSRHRKSSEKLPPRPVETKVPDTHTAPQAITKIGTRKKLPVIKGKSCKGSTEAHESPMCNERPIVPLDSDEDDDQPIAQRRR
ncbi:hypothetical protein AHAS_Ahas13G0379400 [Arachis hypogaea]